MAIEKSLGALYDAVRLAPVEIRNAESALIGRGTVATLNQGLGTDLKEGTYTATVMLSLGQKIVHPIPVDSSGMADLGDMAERIRAAVERKDAGSGPGYRASNSATAITTRERLAALGLQPMGAGAEQEAPAPFWCRVFEGTLGNARAVAPIDLPGAGLLMESENVRVTNRRAVFLTLQILQASYVPLNVVIPPGCTVIVGAGSGPFRSRITTNFGVDVVDELIDLRTSGALSEASGVAQTMKVADVLKIAESHASAAIAAAYIMLRVGDFEEAAQSIRVLAARLELGPDLLLLRAEVNARRGRDIKARDGFMAAAHIGLPMVSTGLNYLVDRLRMYMQEEPGRRRKAETRAKAPKHTQSPLKQQLAALQRIALRCDFNLVFTNYTGMSPEAAGDDVFHEGMPPPPFALVVPSEADTF